MVADAQTVTESVLSLEVPRSSLAQGECDVRLVSHTLFFMFFLSFFGFPFGGLLLVDHVEHRGSPSRKTTLALSFVASTRKACRGFSPIFTPMCILQWKTIDRKEHMEIHATPQSLSTESAASCEHCISIV